MNKKASIVILAIVAVTSSAFAGGYEKVTMWSAKWSSLAGSASAAVDGADAAYFNPAGLVYGEQRELSISLSPSFSTFNAPIIIPNQQVKGEQTVSPAFGITYKGQANDKFSYGAAVVAAAGSKSEYKNVDLTALTLGTRDIGTYLQDVELSLAGAYKVNDQWSVGAAWRTSMIDAEIKGINPTGPSGPYWYSLENLKQTNFEGFKLGAQFRPSKTSGLGLTYRSSIDFEIEGNYTLSLGPVGDATVKNTLPEQISLDYFLALNHNWNMFFGYTFTKYSVNQQVDIELEGIGPVALAQNWDDQTNIKLAAEYMGIADWVFRAGYAYTTQIVPEETATPTFSTPGDGHSIILGAGKKYGDYTLDGAFEYSFASADNVNSTTIGDYDTNVYALHVSVKIPL